MAKWWKGGALIAMWLVQTAAAPAQHVVPSGGGVMPEPLPCAVPSSQPPGPPPFPPGDVPSLPDELALPANLPNAWDPYCPEYPACYAFVGAMALQRQRMGRGVVALTGANLTDTGTPIPANSPLALNFHDVSPELNWGVRGTLGYHWDNQAFELSGFYLLQNSSEAPRGPVPPGALNTFFVNPPAGFFGNNVLWRNADFINTTLQTSLASGEGNYHCWVGSCSTCHWFFGVRYLDVQEHLSIFTIDDRPNPGAPDPANVANYVMRVHNRIVGPQLGVEGSKGVCHFLAVTGNAKAGLGANITDRTVTLTRGDGLLGVAANDDNVLLSHFYEAGLYLDWRVKSHVRLRTGYNVLFVADIDRAEDKVSFDLANPLSNVGRTGETLYHGPVVELQVLF